LTILSHEWLINNIPIDKTILKKWLKSGFIERKVWNPTNQGTPQGGIISPLLANMTLVRSVAGTAIASA
jgi:RNA-directed DNA polymerase